MGKSKKATPLVVAVSILGPFLANALGLPEYYRKTGYSPYILLAICCLLMAIVGFMAWSARYRGKE